jgi:hypothetical protein
LQKTEEGVRESQLLGTGRQKRNAIKEKEMLKSIQNQRVQNTTKMITVVVMGFRKE